MESVITQFSSQSGWTQALPSSMDSEKTLVLAFGDPAFSGHNGPFQEIKKQFPRSVFAGCSTAGEIFGSAVSENTISLAILQFKTTDLQIAHESVKNTAESFAAGKTLAERLLKPTLKGVLVFSDGLHVNGSELLRGLGSVLRPDIIVAGGLAGDGSRFKETWVIKDGATASEFVTIIGFYGPNIRLAAGSLGGWDVFGPERTVTRSSNNVLYELDGLPALGLYKEYLGERANDLPSSALLFPLSVNSAVLGGSDIVRTILAVDEKDSSMTFAGDIPEGSKVQLMKANFSRLIEGASGAAKLVSKDYSKTTDAVAIAISCVGRKLVLGSRTENETQATLSILPQGTKQVGFYSYGEISPLASGKCVLHNQTMTLTLISET